MPDYSFEKGERLKSYRVIQRLFEEGHSFVQYPLRLIWLPLDKRRSDFPVQFAMSVPKRSFRRAVPRNRLRRQIREAYRLHKHRLYRSLEGDERQLAFMVIYIAREPLPYRQIEAAMRELIRRFVRQYRKKETNRKKG
jgi:ribonuclease P protein component